MPACRGRIEDEELRALETGIGWRRDIAFGD
jgi:hypothetical protein